MNKYDPFNTPDPEKWLKLDEQERINLVIQYHNDQDIELPNIDLHSMFHVAVENQVAENIEPVINAMQRLQDEGLDRHDAIHAISSVLIEHIDKLKKGEIDSSDTNDAYYRALDNFNSDKWYSDY